MRFHGAVKEESFQGLPIGPKLTLPLDTVTQTLGIVGQKGSGKTHFATVTFEQMVKAGLPVCVIDPMGVFYGVRSSRDGKKVGLPVLILGGEFADVPITAAMGVPIAQWLVQDRQPVILDISDFRRADQCAFVADFGDELFVRNKGKDHGKPLHLIVDEADLFAAQVPASPEEKRSLLCLDEIVRRGRRRGLGMTMITQRPAVIHKDVLTQIALFAIFRVVAPQDKKAVFEWCRSADALSLKIMMENVDKLETGTAWVWSPSWLKMLRKVQVNQRETFDSGRTPKVGEEPHGEIVMADIECAGLKELLESAVEERGETNVDVLRSRIAVLEELLERHGIKLPATKKTKKPTGAGHGPRKKLS